MTLTKVGKKDWDDKHVRITYYLLVALTYVTAIMGIAVGVREHAGFLHYAVVFNATILFFWILSKIKRKMQSY